MGKKSRKCSPSKNKRLLWYGVTALGLGVRALAALSLLAIAMMLCTVKMESKVFNECVEEVRSNGKSLSSAVNFCNGGRSTAS